MIVDSHTHFGVPYEERDGLDPARFLGELQPAGITHAAIAGARVLFACSDFVAENDKLAQIVRRAPDRLAALYTVHPDRPREALAEIERCARQLDARGLKLHPWVQGFSVSMPGMDEVAEAASAFHLPILFHDGTPCYSMPEQIAALARRHPKGRFILGHAGLLHLWRSALEAGRSCENVWLCLCGPHVAAMQQMVDQCDAARLLWGSDAGFGLLPFAGYRLEQFHAVRMSDALRERILAQNPARLFRLALSGRGS